ncbi:MAG: YigZ family protein [Anaeroplasmataceae bacterium]|nr:YigZ family protein [Anaeroplasmataceae bacterium]
MKFIQGNYENTIVIQKSKFIAEAYRVDSVEEIEQILTAIRKKYYDATHHCFAYRLKDNIQKMSDDGEPAKTAGAPILDVILKQDITNILIVVTRYFGGILLGAGGLVRAYSSAASTVLENVCFYHPMEQNKFQITCSYSSYQTILKTMKYIQIEKTSFLTEVTILGYCRKDLFSRLMEDFYTYKIADTQLKDLGVFQIETPVDTSSE